MTKYLFGYNFIYAQLLALNYDVQFHYFPLYLIFFQLDDFNSFELLIFQRVKVIQNKWRPRENSNTEKRVGQISNLSINMSVNDLSLLLTVHFIEMASIICCGSSSESCDVIRQSVSQSTGLKETKKQRACILYHKRGN